MSSSMPWGDTPFSDLNFAEDCSASGRYIASYVRGVDEPSLNLITHFFKTVVPGRSDFNESAAIEWHRFLEDNHFFYLWRDPDDEFGGGLSSSKNFEPCRPEFCTALTRSFPNNLIGIGLLVAVTIEFLLMIGYCAAAAYPYLTKTRPAAGSGRLHRVLHAFHSTKGHFFHLAVMLCIGVSIAVIYDSAFTMMHASRGSYYGAEGPLMGAVYYPLAATIPSWLWDSRRQWRDAATAVVTFLLVSTAIILAPTTYSLRWAMEGACGKEHFPQDISTVTTQAVHGLATWTPVLLLIVLGITVSCFKCSGKRMWGWRPLRLVFRWLVVIYSGLAFMGAISYTIILLAFAGRTSWVGENWGLGQGIALVLWIPLVYEIVYVAIVGIDRGLDERLPTEFHAIRAPNTESELDLRPGANSGPQGGESSGTGRLAPQVDNRKLSTASSVPGEA